MTQILFTYLTLVPATFANIIGNETQNFNPTTSGLNFVTVHSSETLAQGLYNWGIFVNYSKNTLPDTVNELDEIISSKDTLTFSDLSIGYGLNSSMDLGLNISTILEQQTDRTEPGAQFSKSGLNEIRFSAKKHFYQSPHLGFAGVFSVNVNQVRNNPFIGRGAGPTKNLELVLDSHWGLYKGAVNLGYRAREEGAAIVDSYYKPLKDQVIASVGLSRYFEKQSLKLIAEVYASKLAKKTDFYDDKISAEGLVGLKYDRDHLTSWNFGIGYPIKRSLFVPDQRIYAGLHFNWDRQSKIPVTTPEKQEEPPRPVNVSTFISKYGYQPEDILRLKNKAFDDLTKAHEFVLRTSVEIDAAEFDKPPFEVIRLDGFDFDFGSSAIRPEYNDMFKKLVAYLNSQPEVVKARIEGHTDSIGTPERNRLRSQKRAEAVKLKLIDSGVFKNFNVEAVGFGSDRPVADNANYQGRKKNRRVEIRILRQIRTKTETEIK